MDQERLSGTAPAQKAPVVLTAEDVAALEAMCGDVASYFYKMLDYMDQRGPGRRAPGGVHGGAGQSRPGSGPVVRLRLQQCRRL